MAAKGHTVHVWRGKLNSHLVTERILNNGRKFLTLVIKKKEK